ncbi:hypothetical protein Q9L58_004069 [Maublancomyces gigas]|uniref:Uncharacterized protein n=1 Tax=Discina gigas TaxID=1032678 RepID=A0ABR3GM13_9PEZI
MIPFFIPPVVFTALALMATFATSVVLASVAAISSPPLIAAGLGAVAAVCTFFTLVTSIAISVVLAGVAAISSPFIITAGLGTLAAVCTFLLIASFAVAAFLAAVAAICITFLIVTGLAVSHSLGFIDLAPLLRDLTNIAAKLTFPVVARAATIAASVTGALAQYSRGNR